MLTDAFEEAFYQLDQNRDGVITVQDLERYVAEKNLKGKFIQKWLGLFADEKKVIYYEKFCSTLGIIPAPEKFQQKIYRIDMENDTKQYVTDTINEFYKKDNKLTPDALAEIKNQLADEKGGQWGIKLFPAQDDLSVSYENDGLLYFSPTASEEMKILVWKLPTQDDNGFQPIIHTIDMTEDTMKSIIDIVADFQDKDSELSQSTLDKIKNEIAEQNGGQWNIKLNPSDDDCNVKYGEDGLLHYSPNTLDDLQLLVWKAPAHAENGLEYKIYKVDMTEGTQKSITDTISDFQDEDPTLSRSTLEKIRQKIERGNEGQWDIKLNPNKEDLEVAYEDDGLLYYSPNALDDVKVLVWKVPTDVRYNLGGVVIYECDMSEPSKMIVLTSVFEHFNEPRATNINPEIIIDDLNEKLGKTWNLQIDPADNKVKVDYDFEGKLYFAPNSKEEVKIMIWRQDKNKKRGTMCCGCF